MDGVVLCTASRNTPILTIEWTIVRKLTFCTPQIRHTKSLLFSTVFPSALLGTGIVRSLLGCQALKVKLESLLTLVGF